MKTSSIRNQDVDEALWAAYRCYDKSAVTENLLRRYLADLIVVPNAGAARDAVRKSFRNETTSDTIAVTADARHLVELVTR